MNAISVYVSTAQLVLQTANSVDANCEQRLIDLNRLFLQLRQLVSCAVCCHLLSDPFSPQNVRCHHGVCRLCVRGRKSLRPLCTNCKDFQDYKSYVEDRQMRCLLLCYKSLCEHLMNSSVFSQLSKQKPTPAANCGLPLPNMSTQEIILEGASYDDVLSVFSADLPRATVVPRLQSHTVVTTAVKLQPPVTNAAVPTAAVSTPVPTRTLVQATAPKVAPSPVSVNSPSSSYTAPALVKQEYSSASSPSLPPTSAAQASTVTLHHHHQPQPQLYAQTQQTPALAVRHFKQVSDMASTVQTSGVATLTSMSLPASSAITYVGNNTPGIVVPMVSSTLTTTAPLSIASAKLQSLNRQLAQSRQSSSISISGITASSTKATTHPPLAFKVSTMVSTAPAASSSSTTAISKAVGTTTTVTSCSTTTAAVVTQSQMRNPPSIKTVSNGSAMYSVLYTGIGNKITIKRKTDGDEDGAQRKNASTSAPPAAVFRPMPKLNPKRRGCRCGNATPTPGKLTCCGQRCPCYVDSKSCIGCKCRGCRNPHRPDGGKVRPVIPELACYEIQMADENSSLSPSDLSIATSTAPQTITAPQTFSCEDDLNVSQHPQQHLDEYVGGSQSGLTTTQLSLSAPTATPTSSNTATLIPFKSFQQFSTSQTQHSQTMSGGIMTMASGNQQQGTGNMLQLENLQRESVLIQNAEGKYQVVNVFTTGGAPGSHNQNANQVSGLQRLHAISQLQTANVSSSTSNTSNMLSTMSMLSTSAVPATIASTANYQAQQQHLQQQAHQSTHIQRLASNSSISLQLQQQLKQNNIITVHPITSLSHVHHTTHTTTTQTAAPLTTSPSSTTPVSTTIILTSPPQTFGSDIFSDSSEEFANLTNSIGETTISNILNATSNNNNSGSSNLVGSSNMLPQLVSIPATSNASSLVSLSDVDGSGGVSGVSSSGHSTMVEIIDSNDV